MPSISDPTASESAIIVPPWLAQRSYPASESHPNFSVIYELRGRRLHLLEGHSSTVWQALRTGPLAVNVRAVSSALARPESEVAGALPAFVGQLQHAGVLRSPGQPDAPLTVATPAPPTDNPLESLIEQRMLSSNTLFRLFMELTYRCNEDCIHCFNPTNRHGDELTTAEVWRVLDEASRLGALLLCLTGGEVLMRRDFFDILEKARELAYAVDIYTNGVIFNDAKRERLAALHPRSVSVSIYSDEAAVHDQTTRVKGSWTRSMETLQHLRALGVPINIKCPLMKHTVGRYRAVKAMADELGATVQFDLVIAGKNDGCLDPVQHRVTDPETLRMLLLDKDIPLFVGKERIEREARASNGNGNFCGAGLANLDIAPNGSVTPCVSLPLPVGNVRTTSIATIWNAERSPLTRWRDVKVADYVGCATCERQAHCTKCAGLALVEHGDFLGPSDQDCLISIARVKLAMEQGVIPEGSISLVPGMVRLGPNRVNESVRRGFQSPLARSIRIHRD